MKDNLLISFSGGRTSAYMLKCILESDYYNENFNFKIVFANTGKEHDGTLDFVRDCELSFGCEIVWIEAKHKKSDGSLYSDKGWSVSFNRVDYDTASRNGEPFEEMLSVLGIPCSEAPFCSDQLKRKPIEAYLKSIGWKSFYKAIGIRVDEFDRINPKHKQKKIIYPLIKDFPVNKKMVLDFWRNYIFDLDIPDDLGNCDICWKKSFKVLTRIATNHPDRFDWWGDMIDKYASKSRNGGNVISFFRGNTSIEEIFKTAKLSSRQIDMFSEQYKLDGCSESCEVYK